MAFGDTLRGLRPKKRKAYYFTRVINLEFKKEGGVDEFLESQFTVNYDDGTFGFLFYKEKGAIWKPLDEDIPKKTKRPKEKMYKYVTAADMQMAGLGGGQVPQGGVWAQAGFAQAAQQANAANPVEQANFIPTPAPTLQEEVDVALDELDMLEAEAAAIDAVEAVMHEEDMI